MRRGVEQEAASRSGRQGSKARCCSARVCAVAHLGEAENVVDEEEHVLALDVTEVLGDGQRRQRNTRAGAGGLVHLAVHERGLGAALQLDDTRVHHLVVEIVALAGALADAGEHGEATVRLGNVVDQLHDDDGLADAGTTEEANLATLGIRLNEVNHLNAGGKNLLLSRLLGEDGRLLVDRIVLRRINRATARRTRKGGPRRGGGSALQTRRTLECDGCKCATPRGVSPGHGVAP